MKESFKKLRFGFLIVFLLILLKSFTFPLDINKKLTQYIHNEWKIENGLPENVIYSILQDNVGYLWIGSSEGLIRFDGVNFKIFNITNSHLRNNRVYSLFEDSKKRLWIGTEEGVNYYQNNKLYFLNYPELETQINSITEDKNNIIWFGTQTNGLVYFNEKEIKKITKEDGLLDDRVISLYYDKKGTLWIATSKGITIYNDGKLSAYTKNEGLLDDNIRTIYEDKDGNILFGTWYKGIIFYQNEKFQLSSTDLQLNTMVTSIYYDKDNILWIGSQNGLKRYISNELSSFPKESPLGSCQISSITEDKEGSLWVATKGCGLHQLRDGKFLFYTKNEGLSDDIVTSVTEGEEGEIWVGTYKGINKIKNGEITSYTEEDGLISNLVKSIYYTSDKTLFVGTDKKGVLSSFKDGKFYIYTKKDNIPDNIIISIFEDQKKNLWLGTYQGGVVLFSNGKFQIFNKKDGLPTEDIRVIKEGKDNSIWIGTNGGGVIKFKDNQFYILNKKNNNLSSDKIYSLYEDNDGYLWVGTNNGGLNLIKDGKVEKVFTQEDGFPDNTIYCILEDNKNNLWMSSKNGIFSFNKIERSVKIFSEHDGMPSKECVGGVSPSCIKDRNGNLWFATVKGVVSIAPHNYKINTTLPEVVIEEIFINGKKIDFNENIELNYYENNIKIKYTALSLESGNLTKFRYKLEGFDKDWIYEDKNREVNYLNLPSGNYQFKIFAKNYDGYESINYASLNLKIKLPWWKEWWAIIGGISISLILGIYLPRIILFLGNKLILLQSILVIFFRTKIYKRYSPINKNPFTPGLPIDFNKLDKSYFLLTRKEIINKIYEKIEFISEKSESIILCGEKGVGKSSILNYIKKFLPPNTLIINILLKPDEWITPSYFIEQIKKSIKDELSNNGIKIVYEDKEEDNIITLEDELFSKKFLEFMKIILHIIFPKNLLMIFEDIDDLLLLNEKILEGYPEELIFPFIKGLLRQFPSKIGFILSFNCNEEIISEKYFSPFKYSSIITIKPLSKEEVKKLFLVSFEGKVYFKPPNLIDEIYLVLGGVLSRLQQFGFLLINFLRENKTNIVTPNILSQIYSEILNREKKDLEKKFHSFPLMKRKVLSVLAEAISIQGGKISLNELNHSLVEKKLLFTPGEVENIIKELVKEEILYLDNEQLIQFSWDLFRQWINENYKFEKLQTLTKDFIGPYELLEKLGEGGMGVVYKAKNILNNKIVALKVIKPECLPDQRFKKRFLREGKVGNKIIHKNIVLQYERGEFEERGFIAMEFLEGKTLSKYIKEEGPLSLKQVIVWGISLCNAIEVIHKAGIIHRDIKSENIMVLKDGNIKLMDFGLAFSEEFSRITLSGRIVGTLSYMAPEIIYGNKAEFRSDIWSLGVVLYEMISKDLPFKGINTGDIINKILNAHFPKIKFYKEKDSEIVNQFFEKILAKNVKERFSNINEVKNHLKEMAEKIEDLQIVKINSYLDK